MPQTDADIIYRCPEFCHSVTYSELRRTAELLCYVHENKIHTKQAFEDHVNRIAEKPMLLPSGTMR